MKRILCIAASVTLLICLCISSVGCVSQIEDTNGEGDTSLNTITDEDIVKGMNTVSVGSSSNKRNDRGTLSVKTFSGVKIVDSINVRDVAETVTCTVNIKQGNLRVVIVRNGKIYADLRTDGMQDSVTLTESGKYELKIAGESAGFDLEYKIK